MKTTAPSIRPILIALFILFVAAAAYFLFSGEETQTPAPVVSATRISPPALPPPTPPIEPVKPVEPVESDQPAPESLPVEPEPLEPVQSPPLEQPLPELSASDGPFRLALGEVIGKAGLAWVLSDDLIYHIVVTVDNLPRKYLPASIVPLKRAEGVFVVDGKDETLAISAKNPRRYSRHIAVVKALDVARLADLYQRYYPLFQRAYQDLGYPLSSFNDRLIIAIDDLLAAPLLPDPVLLAQPKILYEYASPNLESRSAGQRIMMRIGKQNAAVIKAKLKDIRLHITR